MAPEDPAAESMITDTAMTHDRRKSLAVRLMANDTAKTDYIRGSMGLMGALPIIYGILTWVFGDSLWAGSTVYRTALSVPGAPQSWGALFITVGLGLLYCTQKDNHIVTMWMSIVMAVVLSMFMISFGTEFIISDNRSALPPALTWGIFSLLFLNLWRLAFNMRKIEQRFEFHEDEGGDNPRLEG